MKIDEIYQLDRYQLVVLLFNELVIFTMLFNSTFNMYGAAAPRLLGCDGQEYNGTTVWERCAQYDSDTSCEAPMVEYEFTSVAVEFNELCSRHAPCFLDHLMRFFAVHNRARFSTTVQMFGVLIGAAIGGQLSDLYGRKRITLAFLVLSLGFSTASSFVPDIDWYVLSRFFIGVSGGGLTTVGSIYVVENLPSNHRVWLSTIITWAPNYIIFAGFAYACGEWRWLTQASNMVTALAIFVCLFLLPESTKYLIERRKKTEAIAAISYINKFKQNKMKEEEIVRLVEEECARAERLSRKAKKYSFIHLYTKSGTIALRTLVASFSMFVISYVTYGLLFNYDILTGSIYANAAISGVIRYIVGAVVAIVDHLGGKWTGRKSIHFVALTFIMSCLLAIFGIYYTDSVSENILWIRVFTLLAFGTTGCIFLQLLIVTAEMFPTGIRSIASAHINVCGRTGNIFGPMLFSYDVGIPGFPYMVLAGICIIDVILFQFFIPETKNQPLPSEMPPSKKKLKNLLQDENSPCIPE